MTTLSGMMQLRTNTQKILLALLLVFCVIILITLHLKVNNSQWEFENEQENTHVEKRDRVSTQNCSELGVRSRGVAELAVHHGINSCCRNRLRTDCSKRLFDWFQQLLARKAGARDPELIQFTRELLDPPSQHPIRKLPWGPRRTPQADYIFNLLDKQTDGFFIEAGAQDGERSSNSVWLEAAQSWTGLLVEIDPWFYTQMRSKMRRAYTINAGLSPKPYITEFKLQESGGGLGKLVDKLKGENESTIIRVPCIPVETLLLALNRTQVDYFSLDVEGMENDVVRTIDYKKFDIRTWSIEYSHTKASSMKQHLLDHGYEFKKQINACDKRISLVVEDYVFQKKPTNYSENS